LIGMVELYPSTSSTTVALHLLFLVLQVKLWTQLKICMVELYRAMTVNDLLLNRLEVKEIDGAEEVAAIDHDLLTEAVIGEMLIEIYATIVERRVTGLTIAKKMLLPEKTILEKVDALVVVKRVISVLTAHVIIEVVSLFHPPDLVQDPDLSHLHPPGLEKDVEENNDQ